MTAAVGVDVGGSFVKAVRVFDSGEIGHREIRPTPGRPEEIVRTVSELSSSLGPGLPLGVGLAGLVDHSRGVLVWAPHLPGEQLAVGEDLRGELGVEVVVDNDANLAALAEQRLGSARGAATALMLTLGTGIGMGVVLDGAIFRGQGHAGEVGHVTVEPEGEWCDCGRRGCWETKVSGAWIDSQAEAILGEGSNAADLAAALRDGNRSAPRVIEEAGAWLGLGVEALVLAFDPEVVVIGGAPARFGDLLLDPVRRRLSVTQGAGRRRLPEVAAGILGPYAGAIGAAVLVGEEKER